MARQSKSEARAEHRRDYVASKLLAFGAAAVILPLFLGASPIGKALSAIVPFGLLMLAIGGSLLWLGRQQAQSGGRGSSATPDNSRRPADGGASEAPPVDRAVTEFERAADRARAPRQARTKRPNSWSPAVFDVIEWRRFEAVVESLFQQAGLETKSQPHGADGGVDVSLFSRSQPNQPVSLLQCKHWSARKVGVDKIRELRGVMAAKKVERGVFATTSTFSADAIAFGQENGIDLLDVGKLLSMIAKRTTEQQQALLEVALEGDYWRPTCAKCGVKMVERTPRNGGKAFWGCKNYPRCENILPMRTA